MTNRHTGMPGNRIMFLRRLGVNGHPFVLLHCGHLSQAACANWPDAIACLRDGVTIIFFEMERGDPVSLAV